MLTTERYNRKPDGDPPATFATDVEIEIAGRLRHQLEQRYLGHSEESPPLPARSSSGQ